MGSAASSYEILAKLAMGGMAEIFLAKGASSAGVERYVVLKRILHDRSKDANFIRMFLDEARLAAQLQHPNIAQVYDIGKLGESFFFTMEYVHGETVRNLLQRSHALRRPMAIGSVLTVIAGSAAGLHHAHDRKGMDGKPLGIVHRDVSPSNLMVSYEGTVKVVDFGVAKAASRDTETRSGTVKGKITYMSPEQCKGGDIDRRSDLFSLGIVMWEMLTTERLFRRASDFENMQAIVAEDVPPPSSLRPEIPPEIDAIVMKLLAKRVSDRFQTADEVHEAIENAAVRSGSALSASSLGRFMRELFGQRPEPWIELQANEQHPEAYTVTSEPVVSELQPSSQYAELDQRLSAIPELSQRLAGQGTSAGQMPLRQPVQPTVPLRVQAEDLAVTMHRQNQNVVPISTYGGGPPPRAPTNVPSHPTMPMPVAAPPLGMSPMAASMQSYTPSASAQHLSASASHPSHPGMLGMRPHTPSVTPPSSPQYPVLGSASHSQPSYSAMAGTNQAPKKSRALIIIIPAAVLGIVIGIALALGGDKKKPVDDSANTVALTPGSAEGSNTKASDPPIETKPVETKPVDTQPVDTKPVETKPVDIKPVDTQPADTKPIDTKPVDIKPVEIKKPPVIKEPTVAKDDVSALFKANKYSDVVSQCAASSKVVALNSTACTLSACKTKETSKAKKWFASVGSAKRASVVRDCNGVLPADKPSDAELCRRNPLACQH